MLVTEKLIRSLCAAPIGAARFCMGTGWDGTVHGWGTLGSDFSFIYYLMGCFLWVRNLGLGWLLLGLVRILSVGLLRAARQSVPIRRKPVRMLILSGRLI